MMRCPDKVGTLQVPSPRYRCGVTFREVREQRFLIAFILLFYLVSIFLLYW
jgi:hypothetical protein